jgi:RNA polymerase sigma-70 factor (ECF subfamily)
MERGAFDNSPEDPRRAAFDTTHWSLVLAANGPATPEAQAALSALCATYWYPLYAFVRRKGNDPDSAQDIVQGFFARLLEKGDLRKVDPARGRFRSFLMSACSHYMANLHDHDRALKRGGRSTISIDAVEGERRYVREPAHDLTPERLFLRRWATTLLDRVLDRLGHELKAAGRGEHFEVLKPTLLADGDAASYRELGARMGATESAARVAAHRMRARYRELLREEVGQTLADPADVEQEIRDLFLALSG